MFLLMIFIIYIGIMLYFDNKFNKSIESDETDYNYILKQMYQQNINEVTFQEQQRQFQERQFQERQFQEQRQFQEEQLKFQEEQLKFQEEVNQNQLQQSMHDSMQWEMDRNLDFCNNCESNMFGNDFSMFGNNDFGMF